MATTDLTFLINAKDQASDVFDKVGRSTGDLESKLSKISTVGKVAFAALGTAAIKFGSDSIAAYTDSEEQQAKLAQAFKQFPALSDTNQAALQRLNSALQEKTKFEDDSIASAQATLATMGLTGTQLEKITPLLLDYAEKTGTDVNTAAEQLGKSFNGQTRALKAVGINYTSTGDRATDFANITAALKDKVGGTAEAMGGTAAGKAEILKNKFGDLQETVGSKLVPILTKVTDIGLKVVDWIQKNQGVAMALVGALFVVTGAMASVSVVTKVYAAYQSALKIATTVGTAIQWAWNAALNANPIGLVVLAITALIGGLVLFFTKTKLGKEIWSKLVSGFKTGWEWIQTAFKVGVTVVKGFLQGAWDMIKKVWHYTPYGIIADNWDKIMAFFKGIPGKIKSALAKVGEFLFAPFKAAFNFIADGWNRTLGKLSFTVPDIPGVPGRGQTFSFPTLPHLATGGRAIAPGLALVGEQGAEVVKLGRNDTVYPHGTGPAAGGETHHTWNIYEQSNPQATAHAVMRRFAMAGA